MVKERIDVVLTQRGLAPSREKARLFLMAGEVFLGTERVTRPDKRISGDAEIEIRRNPIPYVSFGGVKIAGAVTQFGIDLSGKIALDIGSSTGGFVDFLLQHGASKVYAFDAGTHQLHEKLRGDERVILRENCNARYLLYDDVGEKVDVITVDVSFISLKKILPVTIPFLRDGGHIISLVKPQFEVGRFEVGKGGVVKDGAKIERVIEDIKEFGRSIGLIPVDIAEAPREKERKNREYFILWEHHDNRDRSSSSQA
jgi:23S rRNA (cytidine1920-2'-O)/16S rRNA (cytidine1409-2'-O)-methyltransferase